MMPTYGNPPRNILIQGGSGIPQQGPAGATPPSPLLRTNIPQQTFMNVDKTSQVGQQQTDQSRQRLAQALMNMGKGFGQPSQGGFGGGFASTFHPEPIDWGNFWTRKSDINNQPKDPSNYG